MGTLYVENFLNLLGKILVGRKTSLMGMYTLIFKIYKARRFLSIVRYFVRHN